MATELAKKKCMPCKGGVPPLGAQEVAGLKRQLDDAWEAVDNHHLARAFEFDTYQGGVDFTNRVAALAEEEGHHPDIHLAYGKVTVTIWTHKIDGLTLSDFVLAAKIDEMIAA